MGGGVLVGVLVGEVVGVVVGVLVGEVVGMVVGVLVGEVVGVLVGEMGVGMDVLVGEGVGVVVGVLVGEGVGVSSKTIISGKKFAVLSVIAEGLRAESWFAAMAKNSRKGAAKSKLIIINLGELFICFL